MFVMVFRDVGADDPALHRRRNQLDTRAVKAAALR